MTLSRIAIPWYVCHSLIADCRTNCDCLLSVLTALIVPSILCVLNAVTCTCICVCVHVCVCVWQATFASCKYAIPSKHSYKPAPPLPLPFVTDVPDSVTEPKLLQSTTARPPTGTVAGPIDSPVITGNFHAFDNTAKRLALSHYTKQLHATTINPNQHPTQSQLIPLSRELAAAGVLGASSDLKADGRKQYRGSKYDQSGTGRAIIENSQLTLTAQLVAAESKAAAAADTKTGEDAKAANDAIANRPPTPTAASRFGSPPKAKSQPTAGVAGAAARLASSPYAASPRPNGAATKVRFSS